MIGPVDHYLGDRLVVEQRLERSEAGDVVGHLVDEPEAFVPRDREAVHRDRAIDDSLDLGSDVRRLVIKERVERVDDLLDEAMPEVEEEGFASRRAGLRRQDRGRRHDGHQLAGARPGEDLLRPFHPSEQRHERGLP